jgi:hypothetical protein
MMLPRTTTRQDVPANKDGAAGLNRTVPLHYPRRHTKIGGVVTEPLRAACSAIETTVAIVDW